MNLVLALVFDVCKSYPHFYFKEPERKEIKKRETPYIDWEEKGVGKVVFTLCLGPNILSGFLRADYIVILDPIVLSFHTWKDCIKLYHLVL